MNRTDTINLILQMLAAWTDDLELPFPSRENAERIFNRMPCTLAESLGGDTPAFTFEELVRAAGHDLWEMQP